MNENIEVNIEARTESDCVFTDYMRICKQRNADQ